MSRKIVRGLAASYIAFYVLCLAFGLAAMVGTAWVAIHFIAKYW